MINDQLRKDFASSILISDVNSYIDAHQEDYIEWLEEKENREKELNIDSKYKENDYEICSTKQSKKTKNKTRIKIL